MFEVNYSGKEQGFDNLKDAEAFADDLAAQGIGSDLWIKDLAWCQSRMIGRNGKVIFTNTRMG